MAVLKHEKVAKIYNTLFQFEEGKKAKLYPIHKKLQFEKSAEFSSFKDIADWIATNITLNKEATILDAGCGVGYVLLKLCKAYNCKGLGISLSSKEIEAAKANAIAQQLSKNCIFSVQNFDEIENETFDLIIAIESIKHANNVKHTLKKFQQNLKAHGQLIVVEDYLSPTYAKHSLTKSFSKVWNVPLVYTENEFDNYCKMAQLDCIENVNLTLFINKKNALVSKLKLLLLEVYGTFISNPEKQTQLNIYKGALIMDYFYAKNIFKYKLKSYKNRI